MKVSPKIDRASRDFVDTVPKLQILSNLQFVDVIRGKVIELLEGDRRSCSVYRIPSLGGYLVACNGEIKAASLKDPPALGSQAVSFLGDEEFDLIIYQLPEEAFSEALKALGEVGLNREELGKLKEEIEEIMRKVLGKEEVEREESVELPEVMVQAPPMEVLDLIDLVTISDEIAYFLSKNGIEAESGTPEEVNGMLVAVVQVKEPGVELRDLLEKLYEAVKRAELKSLLKVITPEGEYYLDSVTYETVLSILQRFGISELPLIYIKANGEAVLNIVLESNISRNLIPRIVASITSSLSTRNFPWKKTYVKVKIRDLELTGEVIPQAS